MKKLIVIAVVFSLTVVSAAFAGGAKTGLIEKISDVPAGGSRCAVARNEVKDVKDLTSVNSSSITSAAPSLAGSGRVIR